VTPPETTGPEIVVTGRRAVRDVTGPVAFPDWRVTLDGEDMSAKLRPYLMRLRVSERRGEMADQLDIDLDDSAQTLDIPKAGALLSVSLGWKGGGGTTPGFTDKGEFTVDEAEHSGPPNRIVIRARSADFTAEWRKVRDQSWRDKTLGDILTEIAGRQGVTPKIASALGSVKLKLVAQSRESDIVFFMRLGKEHDAIATVKNSTLIFTPMAGGKSAGGEALETVTIQRREGDGHSYRIEAREDYTGVVAKWHDKKAAKKKTVRAGKRKRAKTAVPKIAATKAKKIRPTSASGSRDNPKVLKKVFPTQAEAQRAADAEWSRIQRAPRKLSTNLALGRPEIGAEQPAVVKGFHPEIDAQDWIVAEAVHTVDNKGLTSSLSFEVPDNGPEGGTEDDNADESAEEQGETA
jgi:uncharacterized protein